MVKNIVYSFSHAVALGAGAVTIAVHGGVTVKGTPNQAVGVVPTLSWNTPDAGLTWVVTFSGNGVVGGSIADGVYDITLSAAAVSDSAGHTLAADRTDTFYRLFGDALGHMRVNNQDLNKMSSTFGLSSAQAGYLVYLDYSGDGRVNNQDLNQFANRFGSAWSGFTPTI